jgi:hypothetical protein
VSCSHCRYNNGITNPCCVVLFAATRRPCIPRWCAGERDTWLHCSTHSNCTTALQHTNPDPLAQHAGSPAGAGQIRGAFSLRSSAVHGGAFSLRNTSSAADLGPVRGQTLQLYYSTLPPAEREAIETLQLQYNTLTRRSCR